MISTDLPDGDLVLVEVVTAKGSTPREAGAFMLVGASSVQGTVGGGHLEFDAIDLARAMLADGRIEERLEFTLGPDTGQCCGGRVSLRLRRLDQALRDEVDARLTRQAAGATDVYLFGAGHVGRALARALEPLPFRLTVIENRAEELALLDPGVNRRLLAMPEEAVAAILPGGAAVILTHDHALDFLIGSEALLRDDLAYVGMIGSKTKRGVFASYLRDSGYGPDLMNRLILPIGGERLRDKRPEVIAALVAAELLERLLSPTHSKTRQ
ncbi:xanthine dehydrogenase accessory factor [Rhizobium sp. SG_E_25_P2]|uniref:xanthine dehydrogenase accessory protein XdhC n=1 Tax=Rhizobium sp. SG_E_25_P2 TaxID=2879942 RepID=UPI002475CB9A|nr:xanthine dehydrogenase accessory protein XdhC [Rhizobium sp. SG_E_25_P2]MDH6267084.1 xanthine dehydrogenase accessory factor [Rhizobium sp. SG_E_25_P2]